MHLIIYWIYSCILRCTACEIPSIGWQSLISVACVFFLTESEVIGKCILIMYSITP